MSNEPATWSRVRKVRAYEQVMDQIEERIVAGSLKVGDRLPSERDLAQQLGISRPSLREALRVLEALGIVDVSKGGRDGGSVLLGAPSPALVDVWRLQLALGVFGHFDILETRIALERWSCMEAARRASKEDLDTLSGILEEMDRPSISRSEFNEADAAFHVKISSLTGNSLLSHLMSTLRVAIGRQMVDAYLRLDDWRSTAKKVRQEHRELLALLENRKATESGDFVEHHIRSFFYQDL